MIGQDERGISRGEYEELVNKVETLTKLFRGIQLNNEETEDGAFKHKLLKILDHLDGSVTRDKLNFSPIQMYYQADAPTSGMSTGDYWVDSDTNKVYYYNGSAWGEVQDDDIAQAIADAATAQATADGKIYVYKQTTAPASGMGTGDLWFDTDDKNKAYRYSGAAWEEVRDTDIAQAIADAATAQSTADGKITTFIQASAPTAEGTGDLWLDSDDGYKAYRWSGSAWVDVQDDAIAQALADAATAQGEADRKIVSFYQTSAPTAEQTGDLWFDTDDDNKPYRWSGSAWNAAEFDVAAWSKIVDDDSNKPANNATVGADWDSNLSNIPSNLFQIFYQSSAPASGMVTGDYWVDSDNNKVYRYGGASWAEIQDDDIATAIANAATAQAAAEAAQSTADGKIVTFFQDSVPTATDAGDLWFDTNDKNKCYRATAEGDDEVTAGEWEPARDTDIAQAITNAANAQSTADARITTFIQAGAPTALATGDLWLDSDDGNKLYRWSSSAWVEVQDDDIATAIADAATAQAAADAAQGTADIRITTFIQASAPTALATGDIWFDNDDDNKPYRWSSSAWVAAEFDVADWAKITGAAKPEDNADVTGDHEADINVLNTTNAPIEADADKTDNHARTLLLQFDPKIRWLGYFYAMNFNTSEGADDTYLYASGEGVYEGTTYELWRFKFEDGIWKVDKKVTTSIATTDLGGVVKLGSYIYLCDYTNHDIYRYDLDLANEALCTLVDNPANEDYPGAHSGIATDGTYLYVLGEDRDAYPDQKVYKLSVSGTNLTYVSAFEFYGNAAGNDLQHCVMGCDGTYLYISEAPTVTSENKRIVRYTLTGGSETDFDYMGSPHPHASSTITEKRDVILGIFRFANKWWIAEYHWKRITNDSDGTVADYLVPYLKEISF